MTHILGRHLTGTLEAGKGGTTLFPTKTQVVWNGQVYPGVSDLTEEGMFDLIEEVLRTEATAWPTQSEPFRHVFTEEKFGIREIIVQVNPKTGIATAYPTKGSQVFMWYNGKWNPTI